MAASLRLLFEVDGARELDRAFQSVGATIEHPARLLAPVVEKWFHETEYEQFFSEGTKGASGRWADLSKPYEERKLRENPFALNILQRRGDLKLSLTRPGVKYAVREVSDTEVSLGTTHPVAIHHQRGGKRLKVRKPIDPSETQKRRLVKEVQRDVLVPIRRTGLTVTEGTDFI